MNGMRIYWHFLYLLVVVVLITQSVSGVEVDKTVDPLCGPKSLLRICELKKVRSNLEEICDLTGYNPATGTSMLGLYNASKKLGLSAVPVKLTMDTLSEINEPSIAFVDGNHFLVIRSMKGDLLQLENPPNPPFVQSKKVFGSRWNGEVIVFSEKLQKKIIPESEKLIQPMIGPKIRFHDTFHDFGVITEGDTLSRKFIFSNIGSEPLEIGVRSSCTCTAALLSRGTILPGEYGQIKLEYDTKGRTGKTRQRIFVRTNDPSNKHVFLTVSAEIMPTVRAVPDKLWLDEVSEGEIIERKVQIIVPDDNLHIERIEASEGIDAKILPEKNGSNEHITVSVSAESGYTPGKYEKSVIIHTNDRLNPKIIIPVTGIVLPDVNAVPPAFYFGEVAQGTSVKRTVKLSVTSKKKMEELSVNTDSPFLKLDIEPQKNELHAEFRSMEKNITVRDSISVFVNGGEKPVITIPVFAQTIETNK